MTSNASPPVPGFRRILIVRLSAMGDILHALPAATSLREAFPHATLGWLVEERWVELLCALGTARSGPRSPQRPLADRIHLVNTRRWRSAPFAARTWGNIAVLLSEMRGIHYQCAVDLQGAVRSALLARWSGSECVYGFAQPRENASSMWYTRQVMASGAHVVEHGMTLARAVAGRPLVAPASQLPCDSSAEERVSARLQELGLQEFAVLNPGAGWGSKQWPAERYGAVARELGREGIRSLINVGPGEEALARAVADASGGAGEPWSSSLGELIALMRRTRVFIGGDTGPLHLAAALEIPTVALFGPTDPARNGPFGNRSIVLRHAASPTTHQRNPDADPGLLQITAEETTQAALTLLGAARHG